MGSPGDVIYTLARENIRLRELNAALLEALRMGVQLAESGGHGGGDNCPTCHFLRAARVAIAAVNGETDGPG